jgi:hypothetical protein
MTDVVNEPTYAHPALTVAEQAIATAGANKKLHALEYQALRLVPLIDGGEITSGDAAETLMGVADEHGLCRTASERETVEHVIRVGLAGRSAGVGYTLPRPDERAWPEPDMRLVDDDRAPAPLLDDDALPAGWGSWITTEAAARG